MKKYISSFFAAAVLLTGCVDLDLNPLSEGSSENWYSSEQEIALSLNDLYRPALWYMECTRLYNTDRFTDDWNQRTQLYDWVAGTIDGTAGICTTSWSNSYKMIARANEIIEKIERTRGTMSDQLIAQYIGEAKFFRACAYSVLTFLFGDVPYYTQNISLEEAYQQGRVDREIVLKGIYQDFDEAASVLPTTYTGAQRVTKGAALAMKARTALWHNDWTTCASAAKGCMDLGVYSLHPDFREYFLSKTKTSPELIFALYASNELGVYSYDTAATRSFYTRLAGGTSVAQPSYELFFAFPCTDGKMCDESPLYDPANPFANRDPRLKETAVEFGSEHLDYIYDPRCSQTEVLKVSTGTMVKNTDCKAGSKDCSYNGLALRKGIDEEWIDDRLTDVPMRIIRYADVLLMYAESKIELNDIDQSVLDAMNAVRARAYKCGIDETSKYPAFTNVGQTELRKQLRIERRCELAWENRRWFDMIRWRVCEECLTGTPVWGLPAASQILKNEATGYWIFPKDFRPKVRPSSTIDISDMAKYPDYFVKNVLARGFTTRQYLLPIPTKERTICMKLTQNPGY